MTFESSRYHRRSVSLHNMASQGSKGKARGRDVLYVDSEDALQLQYRDGEEAIAHSNVIAVVESNHQIDSEKSYSILLVVHTASESAKTEHSFDSIVAVGLPVSFLQRYLGLARPLHLSSIQSGGKHPLHIVISVRAGVGKAESFYADVVRPALVAYGFEDGHYQVHRTESEDSITRLASDVFLPHAQSGSKQTILLLSGDGAIVDLVNVLQSRKFDANPGHQFVKPTIALIPSGTGNALANSTGINGDTTLGLSHFFRGTPKPLPTFAAKFSAGSEYLVNEGRSTVPLLHGHAISEGYGEYCLAYGAVVCSWGLHASLVADSDTINYRKYGSERFQMAAKELLAPSDGSSPHIYKGKITLLGGKPQDSEAVELGRKEHTYVLATLVSNLEHNFRISPYSRPLDGVLRLLHFGPTPSDKVMEILNKAFSDGSHIDDEAVGYTAIHGLRIDFDEEETRWRRVCIDGKIVAVSKGGWVEVRMCDKSCLDLLLM